jgi:hypothetical protein
MITEFVPYELAFELKKLGFKEDCFKYWYAENQTEIPYITYTVYGGKLYEQDFNTPFEGNEIFISAPLYQQVFRFFREKYNLHSEILLDQTSQPKYCFEIHKYEDFGNYEEIKIDEWFLYRTYEEAELECIKHLLKVVEGY